uniref:G-patch domain-containing protein n=1 Tax=Strombidinopsis acuminata TaxID=141414 RepID=A0A7S3TBV5_9SPIT|mmetsp:Transcript_28722/g.72694  ORF Transcript_28722/g.72694 Transcript_28722/m.72694 type:complete len:155 (+) Transcript_28722:118-582(+)
MARKYQERLALSSGVNSSKPFESDFGKRIMQKYGWQEGQGLGRKRDGRTECIQALRRENSVGLGSEKRKAEDAWDNWWADCFNNVAKRIAVTAGDGGPTRQAKDDSDSSDDEPEGVEANASTDTGGLKTTGVKRAAAMAGKLRRVLRQEKPAGV